MWMYTSKWIGVIPHSSFDSFPNCFIVLPRYLRERLIEPGQVHTAGQILNDFGVKLLGLSQRLIGGRRYQVLEKLSIAPFDQPRLDGEAEHLSQAVDFNLHHIAARAADRSPRFELFIDLL